MILKRALFATAVLAGGFWLTAWAAGTERFDAYAAPLTWGKEVTVANHLSAMTYTISATPAGSINVLGEISYWKSADDHEPTRKEFFGSAKIRTAACVGSVKVRYKSLAPLGTVVTTEVR